jgi:3-hydroxy-3-methylglutaryl CoA synthase
MLSPSDTRPGVLAIGGDTASLGIILLARMSGGDGAVAAEADERLLKLCQK